MTAGLPNRKSMDNMLVLLSDKDQATADIIREKVFGLGWKAVEYFYNNLNRVTAPQNRLAVLARIHNISVMLAYREMLELVRSGRIFYVPDGMYFLTRILMPEMTPREFRECYEEIGDSLLCELRDTMTAVEKTEMLNYIMFDKYGFTVDEKENEREALLPILLRERRGGTVGLSSVYFLLASYAGLPVYPIFPKNPGYFVAYFDRDSTLFTMDMGNRGRISDPIPRDLWKDTPAMGTDMSILYIYAAALKRFSPANNTRLSDTLLGNALNILRI